MKRKKIGIFTGYFIPHLGGVERYVDKVSAALEKIGYDIVIVTSNENNHKAYEKNKRYSIYRLPVLDIAKQRYPIPRINDEYRELYRQIEEEDIDYFLLNTRFHLTSLVGARMGRKNNKPTMLIEHGTDHFTVNNKVLDFFGAIYEHLLTSYLKRYVDKFYGVSKKCTVWMKHFRISANGVFYNAISASDRLGVKDIYENKYSSQEVVITYAGRLIKEKGVLNLIDAFQQLDVGSRKVKLVIAGDGDLFETLKSENNNSSIDFVGRLDFEHVMALFKRTDIFVYPSLYPEGLPTSILEAGMMGCAIVATPRGGTEEVIIDDDHGIIIDGTVTSLVEAIESLVNNPSDRLKKAKQVTKRVLASFEWDAVAREIDKEIKRS